MNHEDKQPLWRSILHPRHGLLAMVSQSTTVHSPAHSTHQSTQSNLPPSPNHTTKGHYISQNIEGMWGKRETTRADRHAMPYPASILYCTSNIRCGEPFTLPVRQARPDKGRHGEGYETSLPPRPHSYSTEVPPHLAKRTKETWKIVG